MLRIEFEKDHFINEEDFVQFTTHSFDRMLYRDGMPVGVSRERVERIVLNNFHRMKPFYERIRDFVLISYRDDVPLNIIGEVIKIGHDDWLFKVITVMYKRGFVPNRGTHAIKVNESMHVMMFECFINTF
jgi:hypothetical protein